MAIERVASAGVGAGAGAAAASSAAPGAARQTRVLTLEHGEHLDSTLYR